MLKRLSLLEMYCARPSGVKVAAAVLVAWLAAPAAASAQCPPLPSNPASVGAAGGKESESHAVLSCRFDATLTRMFTPTTVAPGTYRVYVTADSIERATAAFRAVASSADVEGAWVVNDMDPLDAYGNAGAYDRAKVARLYVGRRARVARGPVIHRGHTVASITLVSPYPDGTVTRLQPGTLIIEFRVPNAR